MSQPKLAATILLCKPVRRIHPNYSDFKVLMVKRATKSRFAPGAHVFPGGIIESSDFDDNWYLLLESSPSLFASAAKREQSLRIAAIRELFEETSILLTEPKVYDSSRTAWRIKVQKDPRKFYEMIKEYKCVPKVTSLCNWAHWITPRQEKWRYDTYFFLAIDYDVDLQSSEHDNNETTEVSWFYPQEALQKLETKAISVLPPTWWMLNELSKFHSVGMLEQYARQGRDMTPVQPTLIIGDEPSQFAVILPGDELHETSPGGLGSRNRVILHEGNYQYECNLNKMIKSSL